MEVKLGEYVIDVDIVRKNNKNVYFRFKDDTLVVTAHRLISEREIKRMIQEAKDAKTAVDATCGRRTRAVLIMDSGHIILSAVQPETVAGRVDKDISATQVVSED